MKLYNAYRWYEHLDAHVTEYKSFRAWKKDIKRRHEEVRIYRVHWRQMYDFALPECRCGYVEKRPRRPREDPRYAHYHFMDD